MTWFGHPWFRVRVQRAGFLAAVLAVYAQLVFGAVVVDAEAAHAQRDAVASICLSGLPGQPHVPSHRHMIDCALCPHAMALHGLIALPLSWSAVPVPALIGGNRAGSPPGARAPPVFRGASAYPRGPPVLRAGL